MYQVRTDFINFEILDKNANEVLDFVVPNDNTVMIYNLAGVKARLLVGAKGMLVGDIDANAVIEGAVKFQRPSGQYADMRLNLNTDADTGELQKFEWYIDKELVIPYLKALGEDSLKKNPQERDPLTVGFEIYNNFCKTAAYTPLKMETDFQSAAEASARVHGMNTVTAILKDETRPFLGHVRVAFNGNYGYVFDEIVNEDIPKNSIEYTHVLGEVLNQARRILKEKGVRFAMIRAADGRENHYKSCGCTEIESKTFIGGRPTTEMDLIKKAALIHGELRMKNPALIVEPKTMPWNNFLEECQAIVENSEQKKSEASAKVYSADVMKTAGTFSTPALSPRSGEATASSNHP